MTAVAGAAPTELRTARLVLRQFTDRDREPFATMNALEDVMRWIGPRRVMTRAESDALVDRIRAHWAEVGYGLWCVTLADDDTCIGFTGLSEPRFLPEIMPAVEIGWRLAPEHWGRGYATEAARAAVDVAFGALGLERIVSVAYPENTASTGIMRKLGMTVERETMHPDHGFGVVVYELRGTDRRP